MEMKHPKYYILNEDKTISGTNSIDEFTQFYDQPKKRFVAREEVGMYFVSTVFLGTDHNFTYGLDFKDHVPILFETIIFIGDDFSGIYCDRCATYAQALEMHEKAKQHAKKLVEES